MKTNKQHDSAVLTISEHGDLKIWFPPFGPQIAGEHVLAVAPNTLLLQPIVDWFKQWPREERLGHAIRYAIGQVSGEVGGIDQ